MASVLETRKAGTVTVPITVRLEVSAHEKLKLYALKNRQSMALAMDELIQKGTAGIVEVDASPNKE